MYMNDGLGGLVDYSLCLATTSKTSWTSPPLDAPASYTFAVRSTDIITGLEEKNVDAVVDLALDSTARDVTDLPLPPRGLRAFAVAGGKLRVEWTDSQDGRLQRRPLGYRVYLGTGSRPDYATPVAVVSWGGGRYAGYSVDIDGLVGNQAYLVSVRAFGTSGEEQNTTVVTTLMDVEPPDEVDSLVVSVINRKA
ncbi:fibronectin type III domain-containing protein [Aquisphaera giovannonii]|uniref:fibronectin type III domain-containing protein n=1 Tax=Aquisphaera giovannonii TaxID=406548 RepID=UPI0011E0049B|nr:fibronectin type III domain-containing protein [Aquisphaera giovannonii]